MPRIRTLAPSVRLAVACFAALVLGFALLAQVNLWHQVAGGTPPSPEHVLERYHGDPDRSRLDDVLDGEAHPGLDDPKNMWQHLGGESWEDPTTQENRRLITDWIDAGAPEDGFAPVKAIFTDEQRCGACHLPGGSQESVPLDTHAAVLPLTKPGGKYPLGSLLISAHNHLFGFAVLALLLSLGVCGTGLPARLRALLILGASGGAALDIAGWFLTRAWGSPFHLMIMTGGGLFGLCTTAMALAVLHEAVLGRVPADDRSADDQSADDAAT